MAPSPLRSGAPRLVLAGLSALALASGPAAPPAAAATAPAVSVTQMSIKTVRAGQGRIAYRSVGRGRPLVMIMGLSGTADAWPPSFVDRLARHRRVITFDNAGAARSTPARELSIRSMGDDTASLIRALRLKRPDVLGWSMGGMIAQSLAVRHPKAVRRMILVATAPGNGRATLPAPGAGGDLGSQLFPPDRPDAFAGYVKDIAGHTGFTPTAPPAVAGAQRAAIGTWLTGGDPDGRKVAKLRLPVLIGAGAKDRLLPIGNGRTLRRLIRGSTLVTYPDAAHGFFAQHPAGFAARVKRFLR